MAAREPRTASEPRAPRRTCIGCRQVRDKGVLIRLVRGDDGEVKVDVNGRAPGRGAYVCPNERCLGKALAAGRLSLRQAEAIAAAVAVAPRHEARLLRIATARGVTQLEEECARIRAAAAPDEEAERRRRAKADRGCW